MIWTERLSVLRRALVRAARRRRGARRIALCVAPLLLAVAAACSGRGGDASKASIGTGSSAAAPGSSGRASPVMTPEGQAAVDEGNAAYRRKDYAAAQSAFERATRLVPDHAAPWFGLYIVAQARHDTKAADAALVEIRKRRD